MLIWEKETIGIIGEVFKLKPEYQIKETKIRPTTAGEPTTKNAGISFSSQLKTYSFIYIETPLSCLPRTNLQKLKTTKVEK